MTFSPSFSTFQLFFFGGLVVADIGGCAGDEGKSQSVHSSRSGGSELLEHEPVDFCYQSLQTNPLLRRHLPQWAQFIEFV